ncbi:MAG: hypothetical protein PHQ33_03185 [Bacteroidales bacterium]|nr:hypothetical protein [Bacteroidales bacterium]
MNRLNNVTRTDGYYLCSESIDILNKQQDYIASVLDGLNLPAQTCVFLRIVRGQISSEQNKLKGGLIYYVNGINQIGSTRCGNMYYVKANTDIDVDDLLNNTLQCRVNVNTVYNSVQINNNICENAYITDSCSIVLSTVININQAQPRFYTLTDVLQQKVGTKYTSIFDSLSIASDQVANFEFLIRSGYNNRILIYEDYMDVQLYIQINTHNTLNFVEGFTSFPTGELPVVPLCSIAHYNPFGTAKFTASGIQIYNVGDDTMTGKYGIIGRIYY